jgi:hypothetical protein
MLRNRGNFKQLIVLTGVALAMLIAGASVSRLQSQDTTAKVTLSKKQLKELIANAQGPSDHEKLAAYYRQEAARHANLYRKFRTKSEFWGRPIPASVLVSPALSRHGS